MTRILFFIYIQQFLQERDLDRLRLDHIDDMFVEVARADAIIARVMEPVITAQLGGQVRLAHAGHADQGYPLVFPGAEFFKREFQNWLPTC